MRDDDQQVEQLGRDRRHDEEVRRHDLLKSVRHVCEGGVDGAACTWPRSTDSRRYPISEVLIDPSRTPEGIRGRHLADQAPNVEQRDDDRRHEWRLSENARNLN